jgi:putative membrane protein
MKGLLLTTATILSLSSVPLLLAISAPVAQTHTASAPGVALGLADTYFVTQTSLGTLGTPFQVDSGRLAETKGTTQAVRSYAELMVSSHITVNNALLAILKNKAPVPPPTLLRASFSTMVSTLQHESSQTFDADYVRGQVNYQKANAALYQYEIADGTDPDLKAFALETPPKIQDHFATCTEASRCCGLSWPTKGNREREVRGGFMSERPNSNSRRNSLRSGLIAISTATLAGEVPVLFGNPRSEAAPRFLNESERRFLLAATDRLIPQTET